ncbi:Dynactin subunit 3 [Actinomortierella wolfii]|nr:Dynactin subunit 3 [Actinomortierella wolfii]
MLTVNPVHISRGASAATPNSDIADLEAIAIRIRALERVLVANASPTHRASTTTGATGVAQEGAEGGDDNGSSPVSPTSAAGAALVGLRSSALAKNSSTPTPGSLSRRIQKMETLLQNATRERKPIEQFLQKYEESKLAPTPGANFSGRELLTLHAKTELILAAEEELDALAEYSKTINALQSCAELGGLKNVEPEYPTLAKLTTIHVEQSKEQEQLADRINSVMDEYNTLIHTVSEIFLSWDALLTAAEGKVAEIERQRGRKID